MSNTGSLLLFAAVLAGAVVPLQAGANATLGRLLGHPLWATLVSLGISVGVILPVMLAFKVPVPTFGEALKGPWCIWIGGVAGVAYITAALLLAPKLGAASFIVSVIAGQMVISALIDHFALMGFPHRPASLVRIAGITLILCGMIITQLASVAPPVTEQSR